MTDPARIDVASFAELEPATAYALWALRSEVFVVEQDCAYQDLDGRDLEAGTRHLWVSSDGAPIGYLRLLEDGEHLRIGRVLVASAHRGRGLAEALMRAALDLVGDRPSRLEAQSHLAGWYARFGYEVAGPEYLEDGIPHTPMSRP